MVAFHRLLTVAFAMVAVFAIVTSMMTQSRVNSQSGQLERQRIVNYAISNALAEQRKLNVDLSRNLIRVMRHQNAGASPARYLATR